MSIRRVFASLAVLLTPGLLGLSLTVTAQAATGGPIAGVDVNGNRTPGTVAIDGVFKSGTATFAGFTAGCLGGTVGGTVDRGPDATPQFRFSSLSLTCDSPLGDDAVITLVNDAACNVLVNMADTNVHDTGAIDTGATKSADPSNVDGSGSIPTGSGTPYPCLRVSVLGSCTFYVDGSMLVNFDEAVYTVGGVNYQDLVLKGNSVRTQNPSFGCLGLVTNNGTVTLNNIRFGVQVAGGTTGRGINFYALPPHGGSPHGPIAGVDVNGDRTAGSVAIDGIFKSGTATFAGFTAGCIGGTVGGTVDRGPNTAPKFRFTSLNLICDSPFLGDDAVITLVNNTNCNILVNMADNLVHDTNAVDSGAVKTNDIADVTGSASIPNVAAPTGPCLRVSVLGSCTFHILGSMGVNFDEAIRTVGGVNYQDLILKGTSLTTQSPSFGCLTWIPNGSAITMNNIRFNLKVSTGTTGRGINFYD